jgi:hypothetical protein
MLRAGAAIVLLALLAAVPLPDEPLFNLCGFHWLTGHPCPLCGITRGIFALAKGHWDAAIHWNALSPLGFAMLFSLFWQHPVRGRLWTAGLIAFAFYGVWRLAAIELWAG